MCRCEKDLHVVALRDKFSVINIDHTTFRQTE